MSTEKVEISTFTEVVEMSSNRLIWVPLFSLSSYSIFCSLLLFSTVDRRLMSYTGPYCLDLKAEIICNRIIACFMIRLSFEGEQQLEMKNDLHFDLMPEWKLKLAKWLARSKHNSYVLSF